MRIAVTGASGVIGRGVVARLLSQGHDVVGLARRRPESWSSSADFVQTDIRDAAGVRRAVAGTDVVVHCAWAVDNREINIGGTANVLDAIAHSGTRRIVFASSAHVYGADQGNGPPILESDRLNPVSAGRAGQSPGRKDAGRFGRGMGGDPLGGHPRQRCRQLGAPGVGCPAFPRHRRVRWSQGAGRAQRRRASGFHPSDHR